MRKKLKKIMLIDDNRADNRYHQIILDDMQVADEIVTALDGVDGIDYLLKENQVLPEIVFLDINMPKMNGWEFLEAYERLPIAHDSIVIIILTTSQNPEDEEKAKEFKRVSAFLMKPLTAEMMEDILIKFFP